MTGVGRMLLAAVLATASTAPAMDADDVVRLTKAKVGDAVILAQIEASGARFAPSADEIIRLKKEGVADPVIKAMIESGAARPAEPAKENVSDTLAVKVSDTFSSGSAAAARRPNRTAENGTLILENLDSRDYSVQVDAERRNVFYYRGSSAEGRELLPGCSAQVHRLPPGGYRLTWVGDAESLTVMVLAGKTSRATLTRAVAGGSETVRLALFEDGAGRGGGSLVSLPAPAAQPARTAQIYPPYLTYPAYSPGMSIGAAAERGVVVVERAPGPPPYRERHERVSPAAAVAVGALALTFDILLLSSLHHHGHHHR